MGEKQILVAIKKPGELPGLEPLFENSLEAFQKAVGGYIEVVTVASDLVLICNEEGRLPGRRRLSLLLQVWAGYEKGRWRGFLN